MSISPTVLHVTTAGGGVGNLGKVYNYFSQLHMNLQLSQKIPIKNMIGGI